MQSVKTHQFSGRLKAPCTEHKVHARHTSSVTLLRILMPNNEVFWEGGREQGGHTALRLSSMVIEKLEVRQRKCEKEIGKRGTLQSFLMFKRDPLCFSITNLVADVQLWLVMHFHRPLQASVSIKEQYDRQSQQSTTNKSCLQTLKSYKLFSALP